MPYKKICFLCNAPFVSKFKNAKYCSKECYHIDKIGRTLHKKTCPVCNTEFFSTRKDAKYCSRKCAGISRRGIPSPKKGKFGFDPTRKCLQCGKIFDARVSTAKFCSLSCKNAAQKGHKYGVGYKHTPEAIQKISDSSKDRPCIPETRKKISDSLIGRPSPNKGNKYSEDVLEKLRGRTPWNKGTIGLYSDEYRTKISKNHADVSGASNPAWKGGISFEPYCSEFNDALKEKIRDRDNRNCQLCGIEENGEKLSVHHIHYDKENCNPDMISLCRSCHAKTHVNRAYYEKLFMGNLEKRGLLT